MKKITIWEKYYIHSMLITAFLFFFYLLWINNSFLYSSILDYKNITSDVFDGTVYPIEFVPNPLELSYVERKKNYSDIDSKTFIPTPIYNPFIFWKNFDSLQPGTKEYSDTITQRLVFSVPYMGNYNFDYKEFSGSHPGVDIIAPEWTPVRNIAAWVVVDIWYQLGWFWNYILIKHNGVLLPNWNVWDIYSLYAHLSKTIAIVWNKVKKAEPIWYVGQTGTATTPHLHFQIDLQTAPYSPYWPFTTNDMKLAKVWFFDGVNTGLWKENAMLYTINPLKFINENMTSNSIIVENKIQTPNVDVLVLNNVINTWNEIAENNAIKTEESQTWVKNDVMQIQKETQVQAEKDITINSSLLIVNDVLVKKEQMLNKEVELLSTLNADIVLSNNADLKLLSEENTKLLASDNWDLSKSLEKIDNTVTTDILNTDETIIVPIVTDKTGAVLIDDTPNSTIVPIVDESTWIAIDSVDNLKPFIDIELNYKFINELRYFKNKNIISWFSDGTFRPKNNITRIESLKIILLSNLISPIKDQKSKFTDINTNSWENTYINSAVESKIVSLDNTYFYPFKNISRVEWLKLILTLAKVDFSQWENDIKISDISSQAWYYKYVHYAVKNNLLEVNENKFYPNKPLSREELISILYKMIKK